MELQVPYSICAEIPAESILCGQTVGSGRDTKGVMQRERRNDHNGGSMPGSCTYAGGIPPKMSVSSFMGFLKGKSSLMIYERWGNLKFKYKNREFWCRGYYVDTTGKNSEKIREYIDNQLKEDGLGEQIGIVELGDPFTGGK